MPISRGVSSWAFVLALTAPSLLAQPAMPSPRIMQAVDETKLVTLRGNTHPLARAEYDQGAVSPDLPMERMLLLLSRSPEQEAALEQLLTAQQDPESDRYHHWLTPVEFGEQFGPALEDIEKISGWLTSQGFRVDRVANGRGVVEFSGTAAQVERGFHTEIHNYLVNGEQHWANARDPQIPAALSPVVAGIASLHSFPMKAMHHSPGAFRKEPGDGAWRPAGSTPKYTVGLSDGTYYAVTPYDFATIYNVLPLWNAGTDGTGQTIAIVGRSNIVLQDVRNFRSIFGLPARDPVITLNGADPGTTNVVYESENIADVEWSGAIAKGATIDLVVSQSTTTDGSILSSEYAVDNDVAPVLSSSYGNCELSLLSQNQLFNSLWQQAAAEGITVVVASGDAGSAACDQNNVVAMSGLQVNGVASTPYDVAVGGTDFSDFLAGTSSVYWNSSNTAGTLASAKSYVPEVTWNDTCASAEVLSFMGVSSAELFCNSDVGQTFLDVSAGGGGVSTVYAKPSWQSGVYGIPNDGQRDVPDVSLFAGDGVMSHFYAFCQADNQAPCNSASAGGLVVSFAGGTSFGAPAFAGIMALVNQKTGSSQGLANPTLYKSAATQYGSSSSPNTPGLQACNASLSIAAGNSCIFYDVTAGNIDVPCLGGTTNCYLSDYLDMVGVLSTSTTSLAQAYAAGTGYDLATGLGSVNVTNLVDNWPTSKLRIAKAHVGNFSPGQAGATYAVTVSNGASGGPTVGTVTVTDTIPTGLTLVSMVGTGWTCATTTCTRSDALPAAASYPAITVTVNVASNAPSQITNQVTVSGGGAGSATASDLTNIPRSQIGTTTTLAASPTTIATTGSTTLTATVTAASGSGTPTGSVTFNLGSTLLGSATLSGSGGTAQAAVAVTGSQLAVGSNSITANYGGDTNYLSSSSASATVTVTTPTSASGYTISTAAGNGYGGFSGDGGPATSAELNSPDFVAVDSAGNLFIAEYENDRIRKVTPAGIISTVAGNGTLGFSGDGGPATSAELNEPSGVAVDSAGDLFIADQAGNRIRKVTPAGIISTVAGNGIAGFSGDGGPATSAELNLPASVAVDGAGNLFIADYDNSRIRKVTPAGTISTVAGNGTRGFSGDGGPATSAGLNLPNDAELDSAGNLFIADYDNNRIRKVTPAGTISTVAGNGLGGFSGDGGPATSAELNGPTQVAVDGAGNLFIVDWSNRVRKVTAGGTISTVAGNGVLGFSGDGGPATSAEFFFPSGPAVDSAGDVFIADFGNNRVRKLTPNSPQPSLTILKTHSGTFTQGQMGATYTVTVGNAASAAPTSGVVTVTENPPTGLTVVSMSGSGWSCSGNTCTRSDVLSAGASYAITVTVNVASNAASQVTNQATVSGGGSSPATASDVTNIAVVKIATTATLAASPTTIATTGSTTLTATVTAASGSGTPTGSVAFNLGSTLLGSATLTGSGGTAQATLSVTGSHLAVGGNSITASYGGDANYLSSSSASVTVTVTTPGWPAGAKILPQVAFGGGYYSALYFANTTANAVSFTVSFVSENAGAMNVPSVGGTSAVVSIPPYGTKIVEALNAGGVTEGWATFSPPTGVIGYGVLRQSVSGRADQEAVVPFSDPTVTSSTLIWDDTAFTTAVAIVNPSAVNTTVTVTVYNDQGQTIGTASIPLNAGNHMATILRNVSGLNSMTGNRGYATFAVSSGNVAVLGLRFGGAAFTSIPTSDQ